MSKRIIYVAFWNHEVLDLLNFLKQQNYKEDVVKQIEFCYEDSTKLDKEPV